MMSEERKKPNIITIIFKNETFYNETTEPCSPCCQVVHKTVSKLVYDAQKLRPNFSIYNAI